MDKCIVEAGEDMAYSEEEGTTFKLRTEIDVLLVDDFFTLFAFSGGGLTSLFGWFLLGGGCFCGLSLFYFFIGFLGVLRDMLTI
jgi:hypothetical protein